MSKHATEIARRLRDAIETATDSKLDLETPIPWPGQPETLWPRADISGRVTTGEVFIVEIDDHADPARSVVKYWPLLHSMDAGEFEHAPIAFVEVSQRDDTYGEGYQLLAQFDGARFAERYPNHFRFRYIDLTGKDASEIAKVILAFLSECRGDRV